MYHNNIKKIHFTTRHLGFVVSITTSMMILSTRQINNAHVKDKITSLKTLNLYHTKNKLLAQGSGEGINFWLNDEFTKLLFMINS